MKLTSAIPLIFLVLACDPYDFNEVNEKDFENQRSDLMKSDSHALQPVGEIKLHSLSQDTVDVTVLNAELNISTNHFELKCYPKSGDQDGDNYAAIGTEGEIHLLSRSERLTCPDDTVPGYGDCDDDNRSVHPYRLEIPGNDRDDNCDGATDNYEYLYSGKGYSNGETSYKMLIKLNDNWLPGLEKLGFKFYAKIEYGKLSKFPSTTQSGYKRVSTQQYSHSGIGDFTGVSVKLSGLDPATVYRSRVHFFYQSPHDDYTRYYPIKAGAPPDDYYYYTTTTKTSSKTSMRRTEILLQGFNQYFNQQRGRVGITGKEWINGTHYGAGDNEYWCSEFYTWVADYGIKRIAGQNSVSKLKDYFKGKNWTNGHNHYHVVDGLSDLNDARRGDWLNLNNGNHSGMFLAKDATKVWTLEGNGFDNERRLAHVITIREKDMNELKIQGYGHISGCHCDD